jgi:hypothetical protein
VKRSPSARLPDGNEAIQESIPGIVRVIADTARWVAPETFALLPVWMPEYARRRQLYDCTWTRPVTNTNKRSGATLDKVEGNVNAQKSLLTALGVARPTNWTVCHIWGYDDASFQAGGSIVGDPRYYTCIANMILLPTALKGFTDAMPEIKRVLRTCAFHLYGWACEDSNVSAEAAAIRSGEIPEYYPHDWPTPDRPDARPAGVCPLTDGIRDAAAKRLRDLKQKFSSDEYPQYPRASIADVLQHWGMQLGESGAR